MRGRNDFEAQGRDPSELGLVLSLQANLILPLALSGWVCATRWSLQASISLTSFLRPPPATSPAMQCKWKSRGTESAPYPLCAGGPWASLLIALPVKYRLFLFLILIFSKA